MLTQTDGHLNRMHALWMEVFFLLRLNLLRKIALCVVTESEGGITIFTSDNEPGQRAQKPITEMGGERERERLRNAAHKS